MTTLNQKANYIINMVKSVGKNLDYALDIVSWYTNNDREDKEVSDIIKANW